MAKAIRRATDGALQPVFLAVKWVGSASMFCLAAMVVLAVAFALVMATMMAATAVPARDPQRSTGREGRS